jgi:ATP-dependent protease ClpP protease subunit
MNLPKLSSLVPPHNNDSDSPIAPPPAPISGGSGVDIFFYQDITPETILSLRKELIEADRRIERFKAEYQLNVDIPIRLHINTAGGEALIALSFASELNSLTTNEIWAFNEGLVASAGTLIYLVCNQRFATSNSLFLIHPPRGLILGTYREIKDTTKVIEYVYQQAIDLYALRSNVTREKIADMLERETWLTGGEALAYGMVDTVIGGIPPRQASNVPLAKGGGVMEAREARYGGDEV